MDLFICFTPLQSLIANQISSKSNLPSSLFYYTDTDNKKNRYYYQRLSREMCISEYCSQPFSLSLLLKLYIFAKKIQKINNIYLGSIDNQIVHYLLSYLDFKQIITYDDGTANITRDSLFYKNIKLSKFKMILHFIFGRRYYRDRVVNESQVHYSIYKNRENIIDKVEFIPLFDASMIDFKPQGKTVSIFLGTVYRDIVIRSEYAGLLETSVLSFLHGIEDILYLPHPREESSAFSQYIIESEKIAEDIILGYLGAGYVVDIYGFGSSAQFNVLNVNGIRCFICISDLVNTVISDLCNEIIDLGASPILLVNACEHVEDLK